MLTKLHTRENSKLRYPKKENFSTIPLAGRVFILGVLCVLVSACGHEGKPPRPGGANAPVRRYPKPSHFENQDCKGAPTKGALRTIARAH